MAQLPGAGGGGGGGGGNVLPVPVPVAVKKLFFGNDDSDMRETFINYVRPDAAALPVVECSVSGDDRTYPKRTERARRGTAAILDWFSVLHDLGYSLVGNFGIEDFGVDQLANLRGTMSLFKKITQNVTTQMVSENMATVAGIVETKIHANLPLPHDLLHLLNILKNYTIGYSPLVTRHVSHEEADGKTSLFMKFYNRLKAMKLANPSAHKKILQLLGELPEARGWLESAIQNVHLHAVLRFTSGVYVDPRDLAIILKTFLVAEVFYRPNVSWLLDFRRNSKAHLEGDYSVDQAGSLEAGLYGAVQALRIYQLEQQQKLQLQHQQKQRYQQQLHHQEWELQQKRHRQQDQLDQQLLQQSYQEHLRKQQQEHQQQLQQVQEQYPMLWKERQQKLQQLKSTQKRERQELQNWQDKQREKQQQAQQQWEQREDKKLLQQQEQQREQQLDQHWLELQLELLKPLAAMRSPKVISAVTRFLKGNQLSLDAAKAGTAAAAQFLATCALSYDNKTLSQQIQQAVTEGHMAAAAIPQGGAPQIAPPASMFSSNDISDMHEIISPSLLAVFQKAMFDQHEDFCLGTDVKVPKLIA